MGDEDEPYYEHLTYKFVSTDGTIIREESYTIPFKMQPYEYYMCYVKNEHEDNWDHASMVVLYYDGIQDVGGKTQPLYRVTDDFPQIGAAVVLPFKQLGCQWPPHPGEDEW